jgi:dTDP-4-amino-4,6-dideoxygalactose transaminase
LAERHGLVVLEDAAQAHGAAIDGLQPGMLGHAATFSFFPGKNLGAWGDAGAVFTRDADLAERMTMLANHGRVDKYRHQFEGFSSRMDGIQAAILRAKLRHLSEWNDQRRQAAAWYDVALGGCAGVEIPTVPERARHVFHLYVVRVPAESRDAILKFMQNAGIGAGIHYPVPLHEQPAYKHLGMQPDDLPETSITAKCIISLPIFPEITEAQVARVAETLIEALKTQESAVA